MDMLVAVNRILPGLGEHTVTSVDSKHPTVSVIVNALNKKREDVLQPGLWFNTYTSTLYPDSEGEIALPAELLSILPLDRAYGIERGDRLFNDRDRTYQWPVGQGVKVRIVEDVPFEQLPQSVAKYVLYQGMVDAYRTDIGLENVLNEWKQESAVAQNQVAAEHLRNKRYSTQRTRQYIRYRSALRG